MFCRFLPGPNRICGEIAISTGRAVEQAAEFGHDLDAEVQILMLHGVLHLLGMDHETTVARWLKRRSAGASTSSFRQPD